MDEIEGEALGQMLTYLSSELEGSSTETEHPAKTVDHIYEEIRKVISSLTISNFFLLIVLIIETIQIQKFNCYFSGYPINR